MAEHRMKILFLCTGNSCRSQMAEAWARALRGDAMDPFSAGVDPQDVDPRAIRVMAEAGIDLSPCRSKHADSLRHVPFDAVVTLCGHARETCPVFPGATRRLHRGFDDPAKTSAGTEEERMENYRRVRDELKEFIRELPSILEGGDNDDFAVSREDG